MPQIKRAADEGRLYEVFGAGTAAVVAPVKGIMFEVGQQFRTSPDSFLHTDLGFRDKYTPQPERTNSAGGSSCHARLEGYHRYSGLFCQLAHC